MEHRHHYKLIYPKSGEYIYRTRYPEKAAVKCFEECNQNIFTMIDIDTNERFTFTRKNNQLIRHDDTSHELIKNIDSDNDFEPDEHNKNINIDDIDKRILYFFENNVKQQLEAIVKKEISSLTYKNNTSSFPKQINLDVKPILPPKLTVDKNGLQTMTEFKKKSDIPIHQGGCNIM